MKNLGDCPLCGSPVLETSKGYICSGRLRSSDRCSFALWRDHPYLKKCEILLHSTMVKHFLSQGYHRMNRFNEYGKPYSIKLYLIPDPTGENQNRFRMETMKHR